jgi:hypothetical protein
MCIKEDLIHGKTGLGRGTSYILWAAVWILEKKLGKLTASRGEVDLCQEALGVSDDLTLPTLLAPTWCSGSLFA